MVDTTDPTANIRDRLTALNTKAYYLLVALIFVYRTNPTLSLKLAITLTALVAVLPVQDRLKSPRGLNIARWSKVALLIFALGFALWWVCCAAAAPTAAGQKPVAPQPAEQQKSKELPGDLESRGKAGQERQETGKQQGSTSSKAQSATLAQDQGSLGGADSAGKAHEHEEDTELQRRLVTFTLWLVVVGALQFIALVVQAFVFWRTLAVIRGQLELMKAGGADTQALAQQAVKQTELTESQLVLSHRPWVAADVVFASNLIFDQRGAVAMFNVTMRNVGHSVARNVSLWTEFVVAGVHDLNQSHEKLCGIMKRPENENSDYGWMLFPEQQVIESRPVIANLPDVEQGLKAGHFKDVGAVGLHLIGCVDYQSSFDAKKHHQTRFVYLVGRIDPKTNALMGTFTPATKSYDKIVLTPTMHGTSAD